MGRRLLCRYFGLPQLYDTHRLGRKVSEFEAYRRDRHQFGANQDLAGEETTNRCLSGARLSSSTELLVAFSLISSVISPTPQQQQQQQKD